MEVSQVDTNITHAVIGKQESVKMGVSDSATLMHVLSTALYTHPMLAAVREILCNGWDGHIISGNTGTPLKITITDTKLSIRDFGPGIPHDKIGEIYGMYGNSTKRHDGQQTGGFGLGSKAPFAYTDNFEVINHHGGEKVIYRVSKSSMAAGGSPTIDTIVRLPSDETGIQVSMDLKTQRDAQKFLELVQEVLLLGEIKGRINDGVQHPMLPLSESPTGYIINSADGTLLDRVNVRYGNVVYPVPCHDHYAELWSQARATMSRLWSGANLIMMAPANKITIAPSREAVILDGLTLETIKGLLMKFNPTVAKASPVTARQVTRTQVNAKVRAEPGMRLADDLGATMNLPSVRGTSQAVNGGVYNFDARKAAVSWAISQRTLVVDGKDLLFKRLKHAIHKGSVDKTVGKAFLLAGQKHEAFRRGKMHKNIHAGRTAHSWLAAALHKHITFPLKQAVLAMGDKMDWNSLKYCEQRYSWGSPEKIVMDGPQALCGFLTPRILLARSKVAIADYISNVRHKEPDRSMWGWMTYQLPKSDKHYAEIQKVFEDLGYEVHVHLPVTQRAERAKKSDDPNWVPAERKATPKRKGYLTLKSAWDGDMFLLSYARANCKPEDHVMEPMAYVVLGISSDHYRKRIPGFSDRITCWTIRDVLGDKIAVVTSNQIDKLREKGVPELSAFIFQYVDDTLSQSADFRRYLAFGRHVRTTGSQANGVDGILYGLTHHSDFAATLPGKPFRFCVSPETSALAKLADDDGFHQEGKKLPKVKALAAKIPKSPEVDRLMNQVHQSPWFAFIDQNKVARALDTCVPNDPKLAVPYQIVTHLLTPVETQQ